MKPPRGETSNTISIIEDWADYQRAVGNSPATIRLYSNIIKALARNAGCAPESVTRPDIIRFLARPMSPWTKATYWKTISAWSRYLIEFDYNQTSLLKGVPRPKNPDAVARPISDEVVSQLLSVKVSPRTAAYIRLALFEGLRVHEIAKIRGEDFDLASGWLMVTGKGGHTAPIPIHPEVAKLASTMPECGYWFPSNVNPGRPVEPKAVSNTIRNAFISIGSNATAHQLRDTAATRIQRQVKDIRITQTMLRHRSLRSTQKYTDVANTDMQAAVLSLDWARRTAA